MKKYLENMNKMVQRSFRILANTMDLHNFILLCELMIFLKSQSILIFFINPMELNINA